MAEGEQTRPPAIVQADVRDRSVSDCSVAELATECIRRLGENRAGIRQDLIDLPIGVDTAQSTAQRSAELDHAGREFSIAITHFEDAITRTNKGNYRLDGRFAITDAERRAQ